MQSLESDRWPLAKPALLGQFSDWTGRKRPATP